jgi:hypothetical protein
MRVSVLIPDAEAGMSVLVAHCLKASGRVTLQGLSGQTSGPLSDHALGAENDAYGFSSLKSCIVVGLA